jgi:hypothetical protein
MPELRGGTVWSNTFLEGRKKNITWITFRAPYLFSQILSVTKSGQYFLHFYFSIFRHMRACTTHTLSKSEKGELLPSCTITDTVQRPTVSTLIIRDACPRWSLGMRVYADHSGCLKSTSEKPSSVCCGYSSLCCNDCVQRGAVVLDHGMNTLHLSPVAVAGASLQGAFLPAPAHHEWRSFSREKFQTMGHKCSPFHSKRSWHFLEVFFTPGNKTWPQC